MNIFIVEPYYGGSHKQWADCYQNYSKNEITVFSLPARHWKWRMEGAAIELASRINKQHVKPDLFLVTDFINLSLFKSLLSGSLSTVPIFLYFHENQFSYPFSENEKHSDAKDHFAFINYTSALVADRVYFNSNYNKNTFIAGLQKLLMKLPDFTNIENIEYLNLKSQILPVGIHFSKKITRQNNIDEPIKLLWNHRWEYDKNPKGFIEVLKNLKEIDFRLNICGEKGRNWPKEMDIISHDFSSRIEHFGYLKSPNDYVSLLACSDFIPVTSNQDFFGISVIEAAYYGVIPILPKRLSYVELFTKFDVLFYDNEKDIERIILGLLPQKQILQQQLKKEMFKYSWESIAPMYDIEFEQS